MPAARKRKTAPMPPQPPPAGPVTQTSFVSDQMIAQLGLDPATAHDRLADAALVYAFVNQNPWATQDDLARWASQRFNRQATPGPIDRLNAALALLAQAGKIARLDPT